MAVDRRLTTTGVLATLPAALVFVATYILYQRRGGDSVQVGVVVAAFAAAVTAAFTIIVRHVLSKLRKP